MRPTELVNSRFVNATTADQLPEMRGRDFGHHAIQKRADLRTRDRGRKVLRLRKECNCPKKQGQKSIGDFERTIFSRNQARTRFYDLRATSNLIHLRLQDFAACASIANRKS